MSGIAGFIVFIAIEFLCKSAGLKTLLPLSIDKNWSGIAHLPASSLRNLDNETGVTPR